MATTSGGVLACCQDAANLIVIADTDKLTTRQCAVCGRKHYRAKLIGLDLRPLGAKIGTA